MRRRRCSSARPFALLRGGEKLRGLLLHVSRRVTGFVVLGQLVDPVDPRNDPRNGLNGLTKAEALGSELLVLKRESKRCGQSEGSEGSAWQDWPFADLSPLYIFIDI